MKKGYRVLIYLLIGIVCIIVGISLGGLSDKDWSIRSHFKSAEPIEDIYYQETTYIRDIQLDLNKAKIIMEENSESAGIQIHVLNAYKGIKVFERDHTLFIEQPYHWDFKRYEESVILITVPRNRDIDEIHLDILSGDVDIENVFCNDLNIEMSLGNLNLKNIAASEIDVENVMGKITGYHVDVEKKIDIENVFGKNDFSLTGYQDEYEQDVEVVFGKIDIGNHHYSMFDDYKNSHSYTKKGIRVENVFGKVDVEMEDEYHE